MNLQPSSQNCFVCGVKNNAGLHIRFYETTTEPVQVMAEYTVPARYQGYPGVVHGGILATMLDEVTSRTIFRGESPRFALTARLSVRYRKPVPVETPLRLAGRIIADKGRVITVAGEITALDGTVLAEAEAVLMEVDSSFFGDVLDAQTWQVYAESPDARNQPANSPGEKEG